jgi:serine/threonine-protein kinase
MHAIFAACTLIARVIHHKATASVHQRDRALLELGRREALVDELRQELDQVQRGEAPGRYTGQTIGGYRLGRVIGRGAMSEVYEGRRGRDDARAAVKLLHPHVLATPEHFRRFLQEARLSAQLESPHIVRVLDVPAPGESIPYIAMEVLQGETLAGLLKRRPSLPLDEVVELVRQVGHGLRVAHDAGIVHRDLKPANVFRTVGADGRVVWKVLDFGVCTLMAQDAELTQPGVVVGTPQYMSPEQARGEAIDERSDLYSLGVIAYRALTGRAAFAGESLPRLMHDIVYKMPTRPSALCGVHSDVDAVFAVALAKRRALRFEDAEDLADALADAARGQLSDALRDLAEDATSGETTR